MSDDDGAKPIPSEESQRRSAASRKGWTPEARKKASASGRKAWARMSPEERSERIEGNKEALNRPEVKRKLVEAQALLSADREVQARKGAGRKKAWNTEAGHKQREVFSERKKEQWADPNEAKRMIDAMREGNRHPEAEENRSVAMTEVSARPEVAKGRSERLTSWWDTASPEEREQRVAAMHAADSDPEMVERRNASIKKTLARPEKRQQRSALSKEMWRPNSESRKRMEEGRLKAARRLIGADGRPTKNADRDLEAMRLVDQGLSFPEVVKNLVAQKRIPPPKDKVEAEHLADAIEKAVKRLRKKLEKEAA